QARSMGAAEGLARLALPASFRAEAGDWLLHPALMDLATGWAMGLIRGYRPDHLWVPVSYGLVRVLRPLPGEIVSHVVNAADNRAEGATATFNVTLATPEGEVCVEVEGFSIRRLEGALAFSPPEARELEFDEALAQARPLSPAEERLLHAFAQGIRPEEGAEAFARAVALGQSQVIVSSLDLPALIRQTAEAEAARSETARFERPDLDTAYVAPRTDIERTLVGFWQDLLGVGQVGVEDSFFDLGGHSLIAVRLFAMVKKAWRVDFPISILFEAPTVAACAALIAAQLGDAGHTGDVAGDAADGAGAGAAKPAAPARRFTHLVAMHQGEGGPRQPFFLVAGMFGNVLNLRHLAQLMGGIGPSMGFRRAGCWAIRPRMTVCPRRRLITSPRCGRCSPMVPISWAAFPVAG
ncbi:MAG: polyketide synthase dehydratase domain-containing protein, partial [Paracoccaceae bacterium]